MTRTAPKLTNELFPDWKRVLSAAARVETAPVRRCEICDTDGSMLMQAKSFDGWICVSAQDCGRRENKARRVR